MSTDFEGKIERLRLNPGDAALFRQVVVDLQRAGRNDLVVDAIGVRAEAAGDGEAARLWLAVADVWAAGDSGAQRAAFERAAERAAGQLSLFDELDRSAERLGEDEARRAVLRSRMRRGTPATRAVAARKLAKLCASLHDSAIEIEAWFTLGLLDANERAEAIERLGALANAGHGDAEPRIEEIARGAGDDRLLLRVLDERIRRSVNVRAAELVPVWIELAQLAWRASRDAEIAAAYLSDAWGRAPSEAGRLLTATRALQAEVGLADPTLIGLERRLLEQLGDWEGACAALSREVADTAAPAERAELTMRLGDLLATRIGDGEGAIAQYKAAAHLSPSLRSEVEQRLQQLSTGDRAQLAAAISGARREVLERAQDWGGLHEFVRDEAASATGEDRTRLLTELARLESTRLGRPDMAVRTLSQAARSARGEENVARIVDALFELANEPSARAEANAELGALLADLERWPDLARFRRRQLEATVDPDQRARLHFELGTLLADRLGRPDRAIDDLEAACDLRPGDTRFLEAARRLRMAAGQHDDALRLLQREAAATHDPAARARLDAERADLLVRHLGQAAAAVEPALDAVSFAPDDTGYRSILRAALAGAGAVDAAEADARERAMAGDPRRASDRLWFAARELGLGTEFGARFGLMAAQLSPNESARIRELRPAIESRGLVEEQLVLFRILSETAPLGAERTATRTRRAALELAAGNTDAACDLYASLVVASPDDEAMRLGLIAALDARGNLAEVAEAVEEALANAVLSPDTAMALLRRLVVIYREQLGRSDLAVAALRRILRLTPDDAEARASLNALATEAGDATIEYGALADTLDDIEDPATRAQLEMDLGGIAAERMGRVDIASQHWLHVAGEPDAPLDLRVSAAANLVEAALAAGDPESLVGAQTLRLELLDSDEAGAEADALVDQLSDERRWELAFAAAEAGVRILAEPSTYLLDRHAQLAGRFEDWERAVSSLGRWYSRDSAAMPPDRVALYARLALALDAASDAGWTAAAQALCNDPDHPEVLPAVESIDDARRQGGVCEALCAAPDDELTLARLHLAARLQSQHPALLDAAESTYRRILTLAPNDDVAIAALADVLATGGDNDALRSTLLDQLDRADDEAVKVSILRRLVALTGSDEEREKWLLEILDLDLADIESRIALVDIYRKQERFPELANLLDDLVELEEDPESRHRLLATLARIAQWQLADKPRAAAALEQLALETPSDLALLDRLEKLYVELDDPAKLAAVLDRKAMYSDDIDDQIATLKRLAKLREARLDAREGALSAYQRILDFEPANLPVLEEVGRLQAELGRWFDHLKTLERLATSTSIQELRAEVFIRAARVLHEQVGRSREAIDLLAGAFENFQPDESQIALARAAGEAAEAWTTLAVALRHVALRLSERSERAQMVAEIGLMVDEKCDDSAAAVEWLSEAFRNDPTPGPVLDALEAITTRRAIRTQMVDLYRVLAASTSDDEVLWRALSSSSDIAERDLSRPDVAFGIMARATETPSLRERAEEQLERIAREHSLWDKHREWLAGQLDEKSDDPVLLVLRKVAVEEKQLGDWESAFETVVAAFRESPREPRLKAELLRIAGEHDAWEYVLKLYELIQGTVAETERIEWLLEMADIAATHMGRAELAFALHLRAFQLRPGDEALRTGLGERARASGRMAELLAALEWDARRSELHDEREAGLRRVIDLAVEIEQFERASAAWRQIILLPGRAESAIADADERLSASGRRAMLLDLLERAAAESSDRALAISLLTRRAAVAAELDRNDVAIESLQTALLDAKDTLPLRRLLNERLAATERWDALSSSLEATLREPLDMAERETTALSLAELQQNRLNAPDRATATLQRAVREIPTSAAVRGALASRLREAERWGELVDLLLDSGAGLEGEARAAALVEAANLATEQLDDARRGLRLVDQALELSPGNVEGLETRARVLAALERWPDHVDALVAWGAAGDAATAMRAYGEAASVVESRMFVLDRALALWKRAADANPEAGQPWLDVARISLDLDDAAGALDASRRAISGLTASEAPGRELSAAYMLLAQALEKSGADARDIADALTRAVELDGRNARARQALEAALEKAGGVEKLLSLLDEELQQARSDDERARVLLRRGMVLYFDAKNERESLLNIQRAADLVPSLTRAAAALRGDIRFAQERWADAIAEYTAAFAGGDDFDAPNLVRSRRLVPGEEADSQLDALFAARFALAFEHSDDVDRAWDMFAEANVADDSYPVALLGLARLSIARGNPAGAEVHVRTLLGAGTRIAGEILAEARKLSARISEATGNHAAAIDALQADADSSGDIASLRKAADVARRHGDRDRLVALLPRLLEASDDDEARAHTHLELGELLLGQPDRRSEALSHLETAVTTAPETSRTPERALRLVVEHCEEHAAIELVDRWLGTTADPTRRGTMLLARAALRQAAHGGVTREAADDFAAALAAVPHSATALEQTVRAFTSLGDHAALAAALTTALLATPRDAVAQRGQILRALGEVQLRKLDDAEGARMTFEELRLMFPSDIGILEALLEIYEHEDVNAGDDALSVAAELVRQGALSDDLLRSLEHLYFAADNIDGVVQVLAVLRLAGSATNEEQAILGSIPLYAPEFAPGQLGEVYATLLRPAAFDVEAGELIACGTRQWVSANPGRFVRPELQPPSDAPIAGEFARLASAFGLEGATLGVDSEQDRPVRVLPLDPPAVVVSAGFAEEDDVATLRFELARALVRARPEFAVADALGPIDFLGFIEAVFASATTEAAELDEGLARQVRRWADQIGPIELGAVARRPRDRFPSVGAWREFLQTATIRTGVLACFDSSAAFDRLLIEAEEPAPTDVPQLRELCMRTATIRELVTFVLSDTYLAARRRLGLVVGRR